MSLRVNVPVEKGNEAISREVLQQTMQATMAALKPEAAYFWPDPVTGARSMMFVFDMEGSWQPPTIVEPLFMSLNAAVRVTPVMNAEDLQRGLEALSA